MNTNIQDLERIDYIKRLEKENELLKEKLTKYMFNDNTEVIKLNFRLDNLENENRKLKQRNAYLEIFCKA